MRLLPPFFITLALLWPLAAAERAQAQALRFATDSTAPIMLPPALWSGSAPRGTHN